MWGWVIASVLYLLGLFLVSTTYPHIIEWDRESKFGNLIMKVCIIFWPIVEMYSLVMESVFDNNKNEGE